MKDQAALEALIDRWVVLRGYNDRKPPVDAKIAMLTFVLEQLKHERRSPDGLMDFEEYVESRVFPDLDRLVIAAPPSFRNPGTGVAAIRLQSPLLLFLLLYHRERYPILEIIRLFTEKIRDQLTYLDFKKTKTGVTRCFTNTRFAANVLRAYGLLRYSRREAYKTWELSLTGFLAAAEIYRNRCRTDKPWQVPERDHQGSMVLSPDILKAYNRVESYEQLVRQLSIICKPDAEIFESFKPVLGQAHALLREYWQILNDDEMKKVDRQKASAEMIKRLEQAGIGDKFYEEFSQCIQVNELLEKIDRSKPT